MYHWVRVAFCFLLPLVELSFDSWKPAFGSALWPHESFHLGQHFDSLKVLIWVTIWLRESLHLSHYLTPWKPSFGSVFDSWKASFGSIFNTVKAFTWVTICHRESLHLGQFLTPGKPSFGSIFDSGKAFIWVSVLTCESLHLGQCLCLVKAFIWVSVSAPWKPSRGSVLCLGSRLPCALGSRPRPVLGSLSCVTVSRPVVVCLLVPSQRSTLCSSLSSSPRMVCSSASHVATCFCSVPTPAVCVGLTVSFPRLVAQNFEQHSCRLVAFVQQSLYVLLSFSPHTTKLHGTWFCCQRYREKRTVD